MAYYEKNLAPVIDTKNFIDCLNDVRPSVVLDRGNDHCEMIRESNWISKFKIKQFLNKCFFKLIVHTKKIINE